jgi:ankyrin repeat protein
MNSLFDACKNGSENIANKLLENPKECNIDFIDNDNNTALTWACYNKLDKVALNILEYPKECNIGNVNKYGMTALIWTFK